MPQSRCAHPSRPDRFLSRPISLRASYRRPTRCFSLQRSWDSSSTPAESVRKPAKFEREIAPSTRGCAIAAAILTWPLCVRNVGLSSPPPSPPLFFISFAFLSHARFSLWFFFSVSREIPGGWRGGQQGFARTARTRPTRGLAVRVGPMNRRCCFLA